MSKTPFDAYQRWLLQLAPGWLLRPRGNAFLEAVGALLDDYVQLLLDGVKARYPRRAPEELLPLIGETREIERFSQEEATSYRGRLAAAFDAWAWAGTERSVLAALRGAGFGVVSIHPAHLDDPSRWAEFDVRFRPPVVSGNRIAHLAMIVNELKPAHTRLRCVTFECPVLKWGAGRGLWSRGLGVWGEEGESMARINLCRTSWRGSNLKVWGAPYLFWNTPGIVW